MIFYLGSEQELRDLIVQRECQKADDGGTYMFTSASDNDTGQK